MAMPLLRRFRGLYVRIALVAIAASIVAVAAVYLLVVPPLKGDLERQRLGQLDQQARSPFSIGLLTDQRGGLLSASALATVQLVGYTAGARVSVWQVAGKSLTPWADSSPSRPGTPAARRPPRCRGQPQS